jgi:hypothetical protein
LLQARQGYRRRHQSGPFLHMVQRGEFDTSGTL